MAEQSRTSDVLGLEPRSNRLRAYSPLWAELYEVEAEAIRSALGQLALDVQHVGSTAILGILAKPILDIAVGIRSLSNYSLCIEPLAKLGYEHAHWAGLENDEVFGKGQNRTHLVHVVEHRGTIWRDYIRFRDQLRKSPQLAREYERLKIALSDAVPTDRAAYTSGKHEFIRSVLDRGAAVSK